MNTRSKTKAAIRTARVSPDNEEIDHGVLLKDYEKLIKKLKKELIDKDKLIEQLTEEQDNNATEFENMCKMNNNLKKKIGEYETSKNDHLSDVLVLEDKIQELKEINGEYEAEMTKSLNPLKTELRSVKSKYNDLQTKYGALLISSAETLTSSTRKNKQNFKSKLSLSKKKSTHRIKKVLLKLNAKIKKLEKKLHTYNDIKKSQCDETGNLIENQNLLGNLNHEILSQENKILTYEIQKRNIMIESQFEVNNKLISAIELFKEDLSNRDKSTTTLNFIEDKLQEIESFILSGKEENFLQVEDKVKEQSTKNSKSYNEDTAHQDITQPNPPPKELLSRPPIELLKNTQDGVCIFSDKCGIGLGNRLRYMTSKNIFNYCTPGSPLTRIVKSMYTTANQAPNCTHILLVGEKNYVTRNELIECLNILDVLSRTTRVIICSLPYNPMYSDNFNKHIYKINCDIYNLASLKNNLHLIDINSIFGMYECTRNVVSRTLCNALLYHMDSPNSGSKNRTVIEIVCQTEIFENEYASKTLVEQQEAIEQSLPLRTSNFLGLIQENIASR